MLTKSEAPRPSLGLVPREDGRTPETKRGGAVAAAYVKNSETDALGRDPSPPGPVCEWHCQKEMQTPAKRPPTVEKPTREHP